MALCVTILYVRWLIKRRERRRAKALAATELQELRELQERIDKSEAEAQARLAGGLIPTEVEGSPIGGLPAGPVEMNAN